MLRAQESNSNPTKLFLGASSSGCAIFDSVFAADNCGQKQNTKNENVILPYPLESPITAFSNVSNPLTTTKIASKLSCPPLEEDNLISAISDMPWTNYYNSFLNLEPSWRACAPKQVSMDSFDEWCEKYDPGPLGHSDTYSDTCANLTLAHEQCVMGLLKVHHGDNMLNPAKAVTGPGRPGSGHPHPKPPSHKRRLEDNDRMP